MGQDNILHEVQEHIASLLDADSLLSGVGYIAENAKDVDYEIKSHLGKQGIVGLVMTPQAQFIGDYLQDCIAWELPALVIETVENPTVNRGRASYLTGQDASMRVLDVLCHPKSLQHGKFSPVSYEQGEDGGLLVNKVTLRCALYKDAEKPTSGGKWTFSGGTLSWSDGVWTGDDFSSFCALQLSYGDGKWKLAKTTSRGQTTAYESSEPAEAKSLSIGGYSLTWGQ